MKAKEMFENLGYKLVNKNPIVYEQEFKIDSSFYKEIIRFSNEYKEVIFHTGKLPIDMSPQTGVLLNYKLLKCINKQTEELHWEEEIE